MIILGKFEEFFSEDTFSTKNAFEEKADPVKYVKEKNQWRI